MEKHKFDNGLLLTAFIVNALGSLGFIVFFVMNYLEHRAPDELIVLIPLSLFMIISLLVFSRFKKVEFDDQLVYIKNIFNTEIDSFPIKNIKSVKKMMLSFGGKGNGRRRSGKNYKITYLNHNGIEKKIRVMATTGSDTVNRFKKATAFLGADGFLPA